MPIIVKEATPTATNTQTPTPTLTPTRTPTPKPDVEIIDIVYDPPGDPLEGEYIEIKNDDSEDIDMEDWRITSEKVGRLYDFPDFTLEEERSVKVWTKRGTDSSRNLYMDKSDPVWNDNRDCAYLKDDNQVEIDKYCYE
jgi:hypothetical protein